MADPAQLDQTNTQGQVPMASSVAGAYANASAQIDSKTPTSSPRVQYSPNISNSRPLAKRRHSEAPSVGLDFFDPEGCRELRREISRVSSAQLGTQREDNESDSDHTLQQQDEYFDLEKVLRGIMEK